MCLYIPASVIAFLVYVAAPIAFFVLVYAARALAQTARAALGYPADEFVSESAD